MAFPGLLNYWIVITLMMIGFYIVIAQGNLIKKIVGLNIFQVSVFIFYISSIFFYLILIRRFNVLLSLIGLLFLILSPNPTLLKTFMFGNKA